MKTPKPHILVSQEPLKEGSSITAVCGMVVPNVKWVWTSDDIATEADVIEKLGRCCNKCRAAAKFGKYLYGGIDGKLVSRLEAESQ